MSGYCHHSNMIPVPTGSRFRRVSRQQPAMSPSKLRRLVNRGSITETEMNNYQAKMLAQGLDGPYVQLVSGSNGHRHRRYIEFGPLLDIPVAGVFDQFGMSKTATGPWF